MAKKIQYENKVIDPETGLTEDILRTPSISGRMAYEMSPKFEASVANLFPNGRSRYDETLEYTDVMSDKNAVEKNRYEQQPWYASLGAAALQTGTTLVGQTLQGIGYILDPEQMINIVNGTEKEFGNWLTKAGDDLIKAGQDIAPIYQDPDKEGGFNFGDWSWWMANSPSIISTLSFFIPSMGVAKIASTIGKGLSLSAKASRMFEGVVGGLSMRYMESSMESAQLVEQFKQMAGAPLTMEQAMKIQEEYGVQIDRVVDPETGKGIFTLSKEAAAEAGAKAAANNFKANQALAVTDIPQFIFATTPFGSVTKNMTGKIAKALGKSAGTAMAKTAAGHALNVISEGAEEAYQYVSSERSKDVELARMGLKDEEDFSDAIKRYTNDGELWTSAAFGAIGAGVMVGGAKAMNKLSAKRKQEVTESDKRLNNVNSWLGSSGSIKAATLAMQKAEKEDNTIAFDRIQYENFVPMAVEAAKNGNLGHLVDFIERAKDDKEGTQKLMDLSDEEYKEFKSKAESTLNLIKSVEKNYQSNINKTGNWALAEAITIADSKLSMFTELNRKANSELTNLANKEASWTYNAEGVNKSVPQNFKDRKLALGQIAYWNLKKKELLAASKEAMDKSGGKESFITIDLKKRLESVNNKINNLTEQLNKSKENYTEEQFKEDDKQFKIVPELNGKFSQLVSETVETELGLLNAQKSSEFLKTKEGEALFDRKRYEVKKKKVEKAVNNATTKEELSDVINNDDTGEASKAAEKRAMDEAAELVTKDEDSVADNVPATDAPRTDDELVRQARNAANALRDSKNVSMNMAIANVIAPLLEVNPSDIESVSDAIDVAIDRYEMIGLASDKSVVEAAVKHFNKLKAAAKAKENPAIVIEKTSTPITDDKNVFKKNSAGKIEVRYGGAGQQMNIFAVVGSMANGIFNRFADILDNVFSKKKGDIISIEWDSSKPYGEDTADKRSYALTINGKKIGQLPMASSIRNATERDAVEEMRKQLDAEYNEAKAKGLKKFKSKLFMTLTGYTYEFNRDTKDGKSVNSTVNSSRLNKLNDAKDNSSTARQIRDAGGFTIGFVDGTSDQPTKIQFSNTSDFANDAKDTLTQEHIKRDKALSLSEIDEQSTNGEELIYAWYYSPNESENIDDKKERFGERRPFVNTPEGISEAKAWVMSMYELDTSGHIYIGIPNPAANNDALIVRAFYNRNDQLEGAAKESVYGYIDSLVNQSGMTGNALLSALKSAFSFGKSDLQRLTDMFKDAVDVKAAIKANKEAFDLAVNSAHILIDKSLFNKPTGWEAKNKFITDNSVPFNVAMQGFLRTEINQDMPIRNIQPIVHIEPLVKNVPQVKVEVVSAATQVEVKPSQEKHDNDIKEAKKAVESSSKVESEFKPADDFNLKKGDTLYELRTNGVVENSYKIKAIKTAGEGTKQYISAMLLVDEKTGKERWHNTGDKFTWRNLFTKNANVVVVDKKIEPDNARSEQSSTGISVSLDDLLGDEEVKLSQSTETVTDGTIEELEWFSKYFPHIPVKDIEEIRDMVREVTKQGHTAWGAFTSAAIYLRDRYPAGTVYHEAFHVVFNLSLNDNEKSSLMKLAKGNTEIEKEEWLADKFKEILLSPLDKSYDPEVKGLIHKAFRKIKLFLKAVFGANVSDLHELAYRVERGSYKNLRPTRFQPDTLRLYKEIDGWTYFKSRNAILTINDIAINRIVPAIRSKISIAYKKALADNDKELVKKYKKLGYDRVNALSVAEVMQFWNKATNDPKAIYREVYKTLIDHANNPKYALKREVLMELAGKMFNEKGGAMTLVEASIQEFNKNNGIIMSVRNQDGDAVSLDEYFDETENRQSEVYDVNFITRPRGNEISPRIKNFLRYIPKRENGKLVLNEFGMTQYYDFDIVDQSVLRDVAGSITVAEIKNRLKRRIEDGSHPEYQYILDKMDSDKAFSTDMHQAYNRPFQEYEFVYTFRNESGLHSRIMNSGRSGVENSVMSLWASESSVNGLLSERDKDGNLIISDITKAKAGVLSAIKSLNERFLNNTATDEDYNKYIELLKNIGITNVNAETLMAINSNESARELLYGAASTAPTLATVYDMISKGKNPYIQTDSDGKNRFLKEFAKQVVNNTPSLFEASHMTIDGEKAYSYIVPAFAHSLMHKLTNKGELLITINTYRKSPLYKNNIILKRLEKVLNDNLTMDESSLQVLLRDVISISIIDGEKDAYGNGTAYPKMKDLQLKKLALTLYHNMGNKSKAVFKFIPLSDSPNALSVKTNKVSFSDAMSAMVESAKDELNRIRSVAKQIESFKGKESELIDNYHTNANASTETGFRIFPMLNGLKEYTDESIRKALEDYFDEASKDYFDKLIEYKLVVMNGATINSSESKLDSDIFIGRNNKKDMTEFIKEFLANYTLNISAFSTISVGDPAFYKEKTNKDGSVKDPLIIDYFKRAKEIFSPKTNPDIYAVYDEIQPDGTITPIKVRQNYNTVTFNDENIMAPSLDAIRTALDGLVYSGNMSRETADNILESYKKVNHADAQAFITPEFYRMTMIAHGLWNDALQRSYEHAISGKASLEDMVVFQPIKPFMYNLDYNDKYGAMVPVQNKNSEFVLFPALVETNPKLKALLNNMIKNKIDVANFESAVKTGLTNKISLNDFISGAVPMINSQKMIHRGIQMATPEHHIDAEGKHGSQVRVLIISDLDYSDGVKYNVGGRNMSAQELTDFYQSLIVANLKQAYGETSEMFMTDGVVDAKKISNLLILNAEANMMPDEFIDSLKVDESTGRMRIALFDPLVAAKLDSVLTAIFRNKVTNQKINQMALIQTASVKLNKELKLVFESRDAEDKFAKDLAESEKVTTFAKLEQSNNEAYTALTKKGYTEDMWNELTEEEKEHAIKCATV